MSLRELVGLAAAEPQPEVGSRRRSAAAAALTPATNCQAKKRVKGKGRVVAKRKHAPAHTEAELLARVFPTGGRNGLIALGMCYAENPDESSLSQCGRDTVRLQELEKRGWVPHSIDDKHPIEMGVELRHVQSTWASDSMIDEVFEKYSTAITWGALVMDYFYVPGGVYLERYMPDHLFSYIIPRLAQLFGVPAFYLPNDGNGYVTGKLGQHGEALEAAGLTWELLEDPHLNPLYAASATEKVDQKLRSMAGRQHNDNQAEQHLSKKAPFVLLTTVGY